MKIAIIDSGIHAGHPHVGEVAGGVCFAGDDSSDRLGHGTAIAGAIREKVPDAELYAVKVFDRRLSANIGALLQALHWCRDNAMDVVNLSLGTSNEAHRADLQDAVRGNAIVVSAAGMLPGDLPGVIGVVPDPECPRDQFRYRDGRYYAAPYPRPIPGVPPERNLHGVSFAVANMSGFVALALKLAVLAMLTLAGASAAEPITGKWLMKSQEVAGQQRMTRPLTLKITQTGEVLEFEYSVSQNLKKEISLTFTARIDGPESDVKDSTGAKIGSAKLMRESGGYRVLLQGPNRPMSSGKLTLSGNGKVLTSESDATAPNGARAHTTQVFERQ